MPKTRFIFALSTKIYAYMKSLLCAVFSSLFMMTIFGCGSDTAPKNRRAIVFGDSSMIVTETDPRYLSNNVEDIVLQKQELKTETPAVVATDTIKPPVSEVKKEEVEKKVVQTNGLNAPFKALNIFIANIEGRTAKNINWDKDKGASFTLENGELNGKTLTVKGAVITKVMQRSQTVVLLKAENGKSFKLSLPSSNSEWQTLKGSSGVYTISGLAKGQLKYSGKFSPSALRNAAQKLARHNRMSRKEEQRLLNTIRSVRNPNQAPCSIALQSVVWKISGKDDSGKSIERELRIDINL